MRKICMRLAAIFFLLYLMFPAAAQVVSGNGFLKGNYVEAGIRSNGAFGSSVSAPADFIASGASRYSGRVGFIADVGKDGWTTGSPAYIGDFFLPGSPYEAFSVKINGSLYENQGGGSEAIPGSVTGFSSDGTTSSVEWLGLINNIQVRQVASIGKNKSYILIRVTLKNTGSSTVNDIFYTRSVDPDNEVDQGGDFNTRNTIEEQNPTVSNMALVSGKGLSHNSYLGLGTKDCRARVAVMSSFSSDGEQIFNGNGRVYLKNKGASAVGDNAIAVAFNVGSLAPGESATVSMAYVLNASDLSAAMDETDPLFNVRADSYASGSVIDVCSGSVAQLNIVNGDGYAWTWSPATGLNQTTGPSVEATLTSDITYTVSGVNACGASRSMTVNLHPVIAPTPAAAGEIAGTAEVARGWHSIFSVPEIEDAGFYKWSLPPGAEFVSGFGTNRIVVKFGATATSGAVTVHGENSCGNGASSSFDVNVAAAASTVSSANAGIAAGLVFADTAVIDDGITITGSGPVTGARVYIDGGFQAGDALIYDGELPSGVTVSYAAFTGVLSFNGTATPAEWKEIFNAVKFNTTSDNNADRTIRFTLGGALSLTVGGKPHFYEYVLPSAYPNWQQAFDAANGKTFFGLLGYLATINSAEENEFIRSKLSGDGWIGGSDAFEKINAVKGTAHADQTQTEGAWYWVNGPEAGNPISTGNNTPVVAPGGFMNWAPGEPDNGENEHYAQFRSSGNGVWNDMDGMSASVPGYIVEYGGYSSDPAVNIVYTRTIKSKPAAPVITGISDDTGVSESDFITADKTVKIFGTASPNNTVQVTLAGSGIIGTVTADGSGNWEYDHSGSELPDGSYSFSAVASANGVSSNTSNSLHIVIDTQKPSAPEGTVLGGDRNGYVNTASPSISGHAEPGARILVYANGVPVGSAVVDEEGSWTYSFADLADGDYEIRTTATDAAGNTSEPEEPLQFQVDTHMPDVTLASDKQKAVGPFTVTIRFSEPVTDFTIAGIAVSNGSASNFIAVSPTEYTVLITPLSDNQQVSVSVAANAGFDAAGNGNTASSGVSLKTEFQGIVEEIYPNPASSALNIRFKGVTPVKGRIRLVKITGQVVYDQQVNFQNSTLSIDVSKFSAGHYGLIIEAKTFTYRTNVMIAR